MPSAGPVTTRAITLAGDVNIGAEVGDAAVRELAANDRATLEQARTELVARIHARSDDYAATGGLTLVNRALATVGRVSSSDWKHRRKP